MAERPSEQGALHPRDIAIDAKYKRSDAQADVYQALAYAKGLDLRRVALVYPGDGEVVAQEHRIRHDDVEVLVRTVPVSAGKEGFAALAGEAEAAAMSLLDELSTEALALTG